METVNLVNFFSWTALLHTIRAVVTFNITNATLKSKYNSYITFFTMTGACVSYSALLLTFTSPENELIVMFFYYILTFILIYFLYDGTVFAKLYTTIFSHAAYIIASFGATVALKLFFDSSVSNGVITTMPLPEYLCTCLFVFSFSFLFVAIINFVKSKTNPSFKYKAKYSFYYLFPLTHIFSSLLIYQAIKIATPENFDIKEAELLLMLMMADNFET